MSQVRIQTEIPGPKSKEVVAREQLHLAPGLQAFALWSGIAMETGRGSYLTDVDGNTYVDLIGGIGVNALGHCHPNYVRALVDQAQKLTVGSLTSRPRADLVNEVSELAPSGLDRLQLYSGGAEAVESALRLARSYTGRQDIVGFWGAFHGKTAGAMSLISLPLRTELSLLRHRLRGLRPQGDQSPNHRTGGGGDHRADAGNGWQHHPPSRISSRHRRCSARIRSAADRR
jgi:4-aminobutyrate aminotransferase-like enzyme